MDLIETRLLIKYCKTASVTPDSHESNCHYTSDDTYVEGIQSYIYGTQRQGNKSVITINCHTERLTS